MVDNPFQARIALFVTNPREDRFVLISRVSNNPELIGIPGSSYDKLGAISRAWEDGEYISPLFTDHRDDADAWATEIMGEFGFGKRKALQSKMRPRRYGAWQMSHEGAMPCAVISAECTDDGHHIQDYISEVASQAEFKALVSVLAQQVKEHWERNGPGTPA